MDAIPFEVDLGLSTVQGILRLEERHVAIDWRRYDLLGAPQGELDTVTIPYAEIDDIAFRKRLGGATIILSTKQATSLSRFPLPQGDINALRASVKRTNRSNAEVWAAEATLRVAEADEPGRIEER